MLKSAGKERKNENCRRRTKIMCRRKEKNMNTKRLIALLAAVLMIVALFSACSNDADKDKTDEGLMVLSELYLNLPESRRKILVNVAKALTE